jgi:dipeptidyl-peptidase-4
VDITRVGIRGWSFGGYLAILAVLLHPDKFHVGIAGAPVTDWRYYDTHYTERYLGDPSANSSAYDSCSAITAACHLVRPLLLIHGVQDDNVLFAHTLRLSHALFEAGREHNVLPLTGITHMAASEMAAKNLLHAQLSFLQNALNAIDQGGGHVS